MRSRDPWLRALAGIGLAMAAVNLGVAWLRTGIPRELSGSVTAKQIRTEKHPGLDDVCFIALDGGTPIQVEHALYDAVDIGDPLEKPRGSRAATIRGSPWTIPWSHDVRGMAVSMPLLALLIFVVARMAEPLRGAD